MTSSELRLAVARAFAREGTFGVLVSHDRQVLQRWTPPGRVEPVPMGRLADAVAWADRTRAAQPGALVEPVCQVNGVWRDAAGRTPDELHAVWELERRVA